MGKRRTFTASFSIRTDSPRTNVFWDCRRALAEIRRVLKSGGVASFVAWGPVEQNEYLRTVMGPFKKRQPMPVPPPDAPQPYRFSAPGSLTAELRGAAFSNVLEETRTVRVIWPGPPDELWKRQYEISAPLRPYFNSFAPDAFAQATQEVITALTGFFDGREVIARAAIVVAAAMK